MGQQHWPRGGHTWPNPLEKRGRNTAIVGARQAGMTFGAIAAEHGISRERVRQIAEGTAWAREIIGPGIERCPRPSGAWQQPDA